MVQGREPVTISTRAKDWQRELIDQASDCLGIRRSAFVLDAGCRHAEDVLLGQTYFALNATAFATFQHMLDSAPVPTDCLRRTLTTPLPWDATGTRAGAISSADDAVVLALLIAETKP